MSIANRRLEFDPTPAGLLTPISKSHKSVWKMIRKIRLKQLGLVCEICEKVCKNDQDIDCHKVYSFLSNTTVKIEGVMLLCKLCHHAVHFERTRKHCSKTYSNEVANHYRIINGNLSDEMFQQDIQAATDKMISIRKFYLGCGGSLKIDCGPYQSWIDRLDLKRQSRPDVAFDDDEADNEMLPDHEHPADTAMWRDCFG